MPTYAGMVNMVRTLQSITEEVAHSPHTSDQTVQAYITNVVAIMHEEHFEIPKAHNMQLIEVPAVQKPPFKKKAKKIEEDEKEEEDEDEEEEEKPKKKRATKAAKKEGPKGKK
jgi:hypothetical protein